MRISAFLLLGLTGTVLLSGGCNGSGENKITAYGNSVESNGLCARIALPDNTFNAGEIFLATFAATNKTDKPMTIHAISGSPVYVRLWRRTAVGWETFKRYPEAVVMVMKSWTLEPGQTRTFPMQLVVDRTWPTSEPLRLTGELNGRQDVRPNVTIWVNNGTKGGG